MMPLTHHEVSAARDQRRRRAADADSRPKPGRGADLDRAQHEDVAVPGSARGLRDQARIPRTARVTVGVEPGRKRQPRPRHVQHTQVDETIDSVQTHRVGAAVARIRLVHGTAQQGAIIALPARIDRDRP